MKIRDLIERLNEYPDWYEVQIKFKFQPEDKCEMGCGYWFGDNEITDIPAELEKQDITIYITN